MLNKVLFSALAGTVITILYLIAVHRSPLALHRLFEQVPNTPVL
ncbi:hypothetical protein JCM19239_5820 [Vibrio variabilis]|uniref:Uncharacterized protein n=1 Tax=Vibrio variabilis TaxID=990271 RepID=A0ABQ0J895_9VIBR|nr:hypothetical protein JCM19239_5820 [Vibrio variabilis]